MEHLRANASGNTWRITVEAAVDKHYKDIFVEQLFFKAPQKSIIYSTILKKNSCKLLLVQTEFNLILPCFDHKMFYNQLFNNKTMTSD